MNQALETALTQLVTGVLDNASEAKEFLAGELPVYLEQLILWYGTYSLIMFIIGLIGLTISLLIDIKIGLSTYNKNPSDDFWIGYVGLGTIIRVIVWSTIYTVCLNLTWLQIYLAPKVWLVEYVANLPLIK